ncbi:MAG: ABC transporter permease subunit, partial [Betaproteobacteria bacterium]|nr:ABC transporter permease subunit [Betaproteobacteria bacterium]
MHANRFLLAICVTVSIFMIGPIGVSVSAGFMENYAIGWRGGFTLRWLAEVWSAYGSTVMASITIASATVFTTILIAVPCAYALARSKKAWALWFEELITLPVAVPGLASALALILVYGELRWFRQHLAFILVGHVIFTLPFMVRVVAAAFRRRELLAIEEVAATLGASFWQRFSGLLLPAVLPSILSGALMVFTLSIGEFNLTWMLHTPLTRTLPVGLADSYASMRIEIGSAYTFVFLIVVLPMLWLM